MAADGATLCSTQVSSRKNKKMSSVREVCEYLTTHSIDRTQIWRRVGGVLEIDKEALELAMESEAGQQPLHGAMVGCCQDGLTHPSRRRRGGNHEARRKRQREKRERSRDDRVLSSVLAAALNPSQGSSAQRITERPAQLQPLQQMSVGRLKKGNQIRSEKGQAIYVGISTPTSRSEPMNAESDGIKAAGDEAAKNEKKGQTTAEGKQQNKAPRGISDGLLLVVTARINGHPVRALIDSGATRCFITPACITTVGLKGIPRDIFLELGNGQKYLSRGFVPDTPIVTAGLTVKVGLTVTNLLHEVDLVLGVNWLELVNPVIDWSSGKVYLPNAVHTALLQGDWLAGHVKAGTVTVLAGQDQLRTMNDAEVTKQISILKTPKFWKQTNLNSNSWTNFSKGDVKWGFLYNNECKQCKLLNDCKDECKHCKFCKLYVIRNDKGDEVVTVKRVNKNAKLPVRGSMGAAGYDLAAAQAAVVPAHGKCLVKTGLAMALPPGCYGRVAPRSGLALREFIDIGAGVIDSDYRGELGVILFNFSDKDFEVNMGDRIAQLIFEKIKTPIIKELDSIEGTDRGTEGYGSTGVSAAEMNGNTEKPKTTINDAVKNETPLSQSRRLITARQMSKIAKGDNPVFLAIVRERNEASPKRTNKRSSGRAARFAATHGLSEGNKRSINKTKGPKKDIISVAEREQQVLDSVPVCHREKLSHMIQQYRDIFPEQLPKGIPPKRVVEHSIKIESGSKPSYRPPYRLGPAEQDELEEQIRDLLAQGFIRPSCSPYGAPVLFVPKKDGRWRMCIDYRALNKQTVKDRYPLPRIDLLLDRLGQARVFSKLDLAQGYHQIAMAKDSVEKTAFCTNLGQWEYLVMPFGLCNAPSTFQRLMNEVFKQEINSFVLVYLDDILIYSRSMEEHWGHLQHALDKLRRARLYGRLHKCEFLKDKVDYLGFEVGRDGIRTSPEKVRAILDWPRPQSVHDVRSFLGLASYYRKFIKGFSQLAKPMTDLTRDKVAWSWGDAQERSFTALKVAIATAPILRLPDFERQFIITTDASDVAIGAILEQDFGSGLQPIAFSSRKLNPTEIRYSAYERELLGIVWAIGQWKHYFQGPHPIVIQTDHAPLRHLPNQTSVNSRVWRWLAVLQGYDVDIRHIPGKKNPADSLSRQLISDALVRKSSVSDANASYVQKLRVAENATNEEIQAALHELFKNGPQGPNITSTQDQLAPQGQSIIQDSKSSPQGSKTSTNASILASTAISKIQLDDEIKNSLSSALRNEHPYTDVITQLQGGMRQVSVNDLTYKILNSLLVIHDQKQDVSLDFWRIVVPDDGEIKRRIIQELHSTPYSAHPGIQRTIGRVRQSFYWKGMLGDIRQAVENCPVCQMEKSDHQAAKGKLMSTQIPEEKWKEISIDFVTDLPMTPGRKDSILTIVDKATRMVHLVPCRKNITAVATAQLLWQHVVRLHGVPRVIYSDRGPQFTANSWQELWRLTGTGLKYSSAYHPQTQGVVERMNAVVSQTLRCLIHQMNELTKWEILLPTVELVINSLPNVSTGFTPFYLNYGYEPVTPIQLLKGDEIANTESVAAFTRRVASDWKLARENLERSVQLQAKYYDKRHRDVSYKAGDLVLLSTRNLKLKGVPAKLQKRFVGPFQIIEVIGQQAYRLALPEDWKIHPVFHVSLLKDWKTTTVHEDLAVSHDDALEIEEPYWEIEKILRWRKTKRKNKLIKEYLVLWKGFPVDEASWITQDQFIQPELLHQFIQDDKPSEDRV